MATRDLYHGAEADKLLFNMRNGTLTADSQGRLFFAQQQWQNCLIHGADLKTGESYVAKLRVEIPDGAQLAQVPTSGNPDARVLTLAPGAQVRAQVLELYVRRGRVGSFETETIQQADVQAYLENKTSTGRSGGGSGGGPFASITDESLDREATNLKAMGGIMALGAIVGWLDDYCIDKSMKADVAEWEDYIRRRQPLDPENGFLLVAIIKKWQLRDAAYATRSYVSMEMFEAYDLATANAQASKEIPPGLPPSTDEVSYTYTTMWIPPLRPRLPLTAGQWDQKAYGQEAWFPRFRLVRQSLEAPPEVGEALGVLQGSSMWDMLRVLDALPDPQVKLLWTNLSSSIFRAPPARFRIAFAAVNARKNSSLGSSYFLRDWAAEYAMLADFERKDITDWIDSGPGAVEYVMQGRWEVIINNKKFEYSFRLSRSVTWRDQDNPGNIGGEGNWTVTPVGVRVQWPRTGTIETFLFPLNPDRLKGRCETKSGTFDSVARKINPYP